LPALSWGQTPPLSLDFNNHLWVSYSGDHPVSGPWGLHFDAQWRRAELGTAWQQYQARPGVNYSVSPNLLLTLGYAYTRSYPYGQFPAAGAFPEHRVYQQALIRQSARSLRFQHRVRMEQRWIRYATPPPQAWTYQNRFRYLIKMEVPLGSRNSGWYLPMFDEILLGIPPNYGPRVFDQNRIFIGLGRSLPKANVEVGWMNQFLSQRNGRVFESNNTLVVTITSNVSLGKLWGD
jgi:hypothetical protein